MAQTPDFHTDGPRYTGGSSWQGLDPWDLPLESRPPSRRRFSRRRGSGRGWMIFALLLLFILAATVVLYLLERREVPAIPLPDMGMGQAVQTTQPPTTVERFEPLGDFTLTLQVQPEGDTLSFQSIYTKVIPSIVSIRGTQDAGVSLGTGVIASSDGYIITNSHVIEGCASVDITLWDESEYPAKLVGRDGESDLAVLKIEAQGLTPAEFGSSDSLQVGDVALAIGNPLGEDLRGTMTDGIISAINRDLLVDGNSMVLIQTTAALNAGNSGGALLNAWGQVVGITNMKMSSYYDTVEGLGFAIPSTTVKSVSDALIAQGYVGGRPTIGITVRTLTAESADAYGTPLGVRVEEVEAASDAYAQGVQVGDVIVQANGENVATIEDLNAVKEGLGVGDVILLHIYRDGDYLDISVTLVEQYLLDE